MRKRKGVQLQAKWGIAKGPQILENSQGSKMETPELNGLEIMKDTRNEKLKPKDLQNQAIK